MNYTQEELTQAKTALASTLSKCGKAYLKLKPNSPQATLTERRIRALKIAIELIEKELKL